MEAYLGSICAFGFNFAPYGWQACNGQIIAISQYSALFALLGTYYGGNGTSNFALPNLQGRNAIHMGQHPGGSLYTIGETGGTDTTSVTVQNLPVHSHGLVYSLNCNAAGVTTGTASPNFPGNYPDTPYATSASGASVMGSFPITLGNTGGNTPIGIDDPTLVMNYCIAMQGIFPTRN